MKKFVGILVVILVLAAAGSAFARGGRGMGGGWGGSCPAWGQGAQWANCGPMQGGWGGRGNWGGRGGYGFSNTEMPQELRDKWSEAEKTRIDLWREMDRNPMDRAKVESLHTKHNALRQEIADWWFKQRLDQFQQPKP